jgi:hypothetical protein
MQFRWVAIIALWTFLSAPILGVPSKSPTARPGKDVARSVEFGAGRRDCR